jgi:hypothetical protein
MNGWMWRPAEAETIYKQAPRAKGGREPGPEWAGPVGPGRSAQAGRPRPNSARFGPGFLPGCFSRDPLFVCTWLWAFDVVSFTVKA